MALPMIGGFTLKNAGGFVCRGRLAYFSDSGEQTLSGETSDITLGFTRDVNPEVLGVPDGAMVQLFVDIVWGTDNQARQGFIYQKGNPRVASYSISGTTLDNNLGLNGVG